MRRQVNPRTPSVKILLDFFYHAIHSKHVKPTTLLAYRSHLKWYIHSSFHCILDSILISRFISGVQNVHFSPLPKPRTTWDVNQVLDHLASLPDNRVLSLMQLSVKLVMLLLISTFRRKCELHSLHLQHKWYFPNQILFALVRPPKPGVCILHSNRHFGYFPVTMFPDNYKLCPVRTLNDYIYRTARLRNDGYLLITTQHPFKPISSMTLRRWILSGLKDAGIDVSAFSMPAYSTRHAASSKAFMAGVQLDAVLKHAGWASVSTFVTHYNLPIVTNNPVQGQGSMISHMLKLRPNAMSTLSSRLKAKNLHPAAAALLSKANIVREKRLARQVLTLRNSDLPNSSVTLNLRNV